MCQIDVLQRLKLERPVIESPLKNLPKTLYETYDRILQAIPEEDRVFVHHVLHWIEINNMILPKRNIACQLLLEGVALSMASTKTEEIGRFYDVYTLRELCGCLVRVSDDSDAFPFGQASFAHYTVEEYLESRKHVAIDLDSSMEGQSSRQDVLRAIYWEACQSRSCCMLQNMSPAQDTAWSSMPPSTAHGETRLFKALYKNISSYCVISTQILMKMKRMDVLLDELAIRSLDPSSSHYMMLISSLKQSFPDAGSFKSLKSNAFF